MMGSQEEAGCVKGLGKKPGGLAMGYCPQEA